MKRNLILLFAVCLGVFALATSGYTQIPVPEELTVIRSGANVVLRWEAVPGASHYNVYKDTDPDVDTSFPYASPVNTTSYTDGMGANDEIYFYAVTATMPIGTLTGAIQDTSGANYEGVLVKCTHQTIANLVVFTHTLANGSYTITDVPVGTYDVDIYHVMRPVYSTTVSISNGGTATLNYQFPNFNYVVKSGQIISASEVWDNDHVYQLHGRVEVAAGAVLTIEYGTTIVGEYPDLGYLEIEKQGQIYAVGTKYMPIVFTSNRREFGPIYPDSTASNGDWGGIIISGRAQNNTGVDVPGEGDTGPHGNGTSTEYNHESSGTLRYVRLEWPGYAFTTENELNGMALQSVGDGTDISYLQVVYGADDCIEWFGGVCPFHHGVFTNSGDDHFDWTDGADFWAHHVFVVTRDVASDCGIEADNRETNHDQLPRSNGRLSNMTFVGKRGVSGSGGTELAKFRRGTQFQVFNTIFTYAKSWAIDIDDSRTSQLAENGGSHFDYNILWDNGIDLPTLNTYPGTSGPEGDQHFGVESSEWDNVLCQPLATRPVEPVHFSPTGWEQDDPSNGVSGCGYVGTSTTNKVINPLLVDPTNYDPRPQAGSPALNPANVAPADSLSPYNLPFAPYIGAFSGPNDDWMAGWTDFYPGE